MEAAGCSWVHVRKEEDNSQQKKACTKRPGNEKKIAEMHCAVIVYLPCAKSSIEAYWACSLDPLQPIEAGVLTIFHFTEEGN